MVTSSGLDSVVFADTAISHVDGEAGQLVIAGRDVEQLATTESFEQAARAVLAAGGAEITGGFGAARQAAWQMLPQLGAALAATDAMDALRAALAHLQS